MTPGSPGFVGQKVVEDKDKVTEKEQALYRSGLVTLLHLTEHSRPDITMCICYGLICSLVAMHDHGTLMLAEWVVHKL